jgi:hypothetical protein
MDFFFEGNFASFLVLTVFLGGGAAFLAGRANAKGWKSPLILFINMLILNCGLRFLHFALFQQDLLSVEHFISQGIILELFAFLGYRLTLARQMTSKYPWLYEKTSPFSWRQKS